MLIISIVNYVCIYIYIDINECEEELYDCPDDMMCNNVVGNYTCDCPDGTMDNGTDCVCKNTAINNKGL